MVQQKQDTPISVSIRVNTEVSMKKLNEKGMSVIEVILTFALIMTIVASILALIMNYRNKMQTNLTYLDLSTYKNTITKEIQDDIMRLGIADINHGGECTSSEYSGQFSACSNIVFKTGVEKILAVSKLDISDRNSVLNKYIRYGDTKYPIEDTLPNTIPAGRQPGEFQSIFVSDSDFLSVDSTILADGTEIKIYSIDIYIEHIDFDDDFGIHIVATNNDVLTTNSYTKDFAYTGDVQTYTIPVTGTYRLELWGASGGDAGPYKGGLGGYTSGYIHLQAGQVLYFYVGGEGSQSAVGGWNGGGNLVAGQEYFGASGGGSTDVRLVSGAWNNFDSLKSRIMVAGGGGGANYRNRTSATELILYGSGDGGAGGCLNGDDVNCAGISEQHQASTGYTSYNEYTVGSGGAQTHAGEHRTYYASGELKYPPTITNGFGISDTTNAQSGAGGGWYTGGNAGHGGAGGGSSYISGHNGCRAISQGSTSTSITHQTGSEYTNFVFNNTLMIDGDGNKWTTEKTDEKVIMPNNGITNVEIGNDGNGYARVTYLGI